MIESNFKPPTPPLPTQGRVTTQEIKADPPREIAATAPSIAQFAINQLSNRQSKIHGGEGINNPAVGKSLSIFKDTESGRYVTMYRNADGKVEQIPDERALEFYARIAGELDHLLEDPKKPAVDIET
jgi:uncharacterized FlaG/YvyC family protein